MKKDSIEILWLSFILTGLLILTFQDSEFTINDMMYKNETDDYYIES